MEKNSNGTLRYPGATYFFVDAVMRHVVEEEDCGTMTDDLRFESGNYFHTREEAENRLKRV